jgi:hypothetical protein
MMQAVKEIFANQPGRPKPVIQALPAQPISVRTGSPVGPAPAPQAESEAKAGGTPCRPNRLWHSCQGHIGWPCESRPRPARSRTDIPGVAWRGRRWRHTSVSFLGSVPSRPTNPLHVSVDSGASFCHQGAVETSALRPGKRVTNAALTCTVQAARLKLHCRKIDRVFFSINFRQTCGRLMSLCGVSGTQNENIFVQ